MGDHAMPRLWLWIPLDTSLSKGQKGSPFEHTIRRVSTCRRFCSTNDNIDQTSDVFQDLTDDVWSELTAEVLEPVSTGTDEQCTSYVMVSFLHDCSALCEIFHGRFDGFDPSWTNSWSWKFKLHHTPPVHIAENANLASLSLPLWNARLQEAVDEVV